MNKPHHQHSNKYLIATCNFLKITLLFLGLVNLVLAGYLVQQKELLIGFLCLLGGIYPITVYIQFYGKKFS